MENSFNLGDDNTYKHYYYPLSPRDEEDSGEMVIKTNSDTRKRKSSVGNLEEFFEVQPKSKKKKTLSSTVARAVAGGVSYITTNTDDGNQSTHLIKVEVYDMKKLAKIPITEHWKHANIRIKYYVKENDSKIFDNTNKVIYSITKEIAESDNVKKYFFNSDK